MGTLLTYKRQLLPRKVSATENLLRQNPFIVNPDKVKDMNVLKKNSRHKPKSVHAI